MPGLSLYLDPATLVALVWPVTQDGQGRAAAASQLPIALSPSLANVEFHLQAFVADASAPYGLSMSNVLVKTIGQ